ncbi:Dynein heavy chain family protein, partial [Reticulomyxa filosa]
QEEIIGFDPTEFDQVAKLQKDIKPFDELWSLYLEYYEKSKEWRTVAFCNLNPDDVSKDHKTMFNTSNKLKNTFERAKMPSPGKVADTVNRNLNDWRKFLPVISAVCTEGLKDRHWERIFKTLGPGVDTKEAVNFKAINRILNLLLLKSKS